MQAFVTSAAVFGCSFLFSLFLITTADERIRRNSGLFVLTYAVSTATAFISFWTSAVLGLVALAEHLIDYAKGC